MPPTGGGAGGQRLMRGSTLRFDHVAHTQNEQGDAVAGGGTEVGAGGHEPLRLDHVGH